MSYSGSGTHAATVRNGSTESLRHAHLWLSCHGYESRSIQHLDLGVAGADSKLSVGFDLPEVDHGGKVRSKLRSKQQRLKDAGFEVLITDDDGFDNLVQSRIKGLVTEEHPHVVADISSMNRTRIASLLLACASTQFPGGCDLDLLYFPATFASHKHGYEPLESFSPVHERVAGWPLEPDFPLALVMGLGTEPRRADGIVESMEPDILGVFEPVGDESEFSEDLRKENRRVLEVAGEPIRYDVRDPESLYRQLVSTVERLSQRARVIIVPLGPKLFTAMAINAALKTGPQVGVWKASAGSGVQPIDVHGSRSAVLTSLEFPP